MKATAIAFIIVGGYWVAKGLESFSQDQTKGIALMGLGILLLPLARYFWNKDLTSRGSSQE